MQLCRRGKKHGEAVEGKRFCQPCLDKEKKYRRDNKDKLREKKTCEHKRQRPRCKECCGGGICQHQRQRSRCKECKGGSICQHQRRRSRCKECNPVSYLQQRVSCRIREALKGSKSKRSLEYLGCSIEYFKIHLENQFSEGMNWDNYGEWEIDHYVPVLYMLSGNEEDDLEVVADRLHWSNTQPMWKAENMLKGNRYIG